MAIGSADNDIIDCTDIAEFYCRPGFPSRSLANRESPLILEGLPPRPASAGPQRRRVRRRRRSRRPSHGDPRGPARSALPAVLCALPPQPPRPPCRASAAALLAELVEKLPFG